MATREYEGGEASQLKTGKSRKEEATQQQCTAADENGGVCTDCQDLAGAPLLIAEGAVATNKLLYCGVFWMAKPERMNKVGTRSG